MTVKSTHPKMGAVMSAVYLLADTACFLAALIKLFGGEGKLCYNIRLARATVKGVVFGGNIDKIALFQGAESIFHVQAVGLRRSALNMIVLTSVMAVKDKAVLSVVGQLRFAKGNIP